MTTPVFQSRARGRDIAELFGYTPDDRSAEALRMKSGRQCPFVPGRCSKTNHDGSEIYGVCSVSHGMAGLDSDVVVCPRRLYVNNYKCLMDVAAHVWPSCPNEHFVIGGAHRDLREKAARFDQAVVAFGQGSGSEVGFSEGGRLSLDWVLQRYEREKSGRLEPKEFIGLEVQSIDITGNYREAWGTYMAMSDPTKTYRVPDSGHGLNWANVHKRLIPQLIRKGHVLSDAPRCLGIFFVLPDSVFQKFEEILPGLKSKEERPKGGLSVFTYSLVSGVLESR